MAFKREWKDPNENIIGMNNIFMRYFTELYIVLNRMYYATLIHLFSSIQKKEKV